MSVQLPSAESIRSQVASEAARIAGVEVEKILPLLGAVEPVSLRSTDDCSWRLASCAGLPVEIRAIERAVGVVHRLRPLMRAP